MRKAFLIGSLLCSTAGLAAPARASTTEAEIMRLGDAYGAGHFDQIDAIRFTFNVENGTFTIHRAWEWRPKTDQVTLTSNSSSPATYDYARKDLALHGTDLSRQVDAWFINDQYWLLSPLHLVWDSGTQITFDGEKDLPIPPGHAKRMTVTYPKEGGPKPGDMYEIYYGPLIDWAKSFSKPPKEDPRDWNRSRYVFRQWVFYRGGTSTQTLTATWEKYAKLGPLIVSLDHRDAAGQFHLWLSDVAVRLQGKSDWINAQPLR